MTEQSIAPSVSLVNGRPATTSQKIAEHFGKPHDRVLKDIRNLCGNCPEKFTAVNFDASEYTDSTGRKLPMYTVYFDGFMLLVMSYTGKKALGMKLAYIAAFNSMREQLEGKKSAPRQRRPRKALPAPEQLALPTPAKDKFEAYLEEVEAFRARTDSEIRRLLKDGLGLVDIYKFGPEGITGFSSIFLNWLHDVAVSPSPLVASYWSMDRAIEYSPLYIVREMEKILPNRLRR